MFPQVATVMKKRMLLSSIDCVLAIKINDGCILSKVLVLRSVAFYDAPNAI
jgi:hypothetical protein